MQQDARRIGRREKALEQLVDLAVAAGPPATQTDKYFSHTSRIVSRNGEVNVVYAVFLRQRVIAALEPAIRLLARLVPEARVKRYYEEGQIVPSEMKMMEIAGPLSKLSEVETLILQKVGFPCVCAINAYDMCRALPRAAFLDMHGRHGTGAEMNLLAAYGASVGSMTAQRAASDGVTGFIGSSQDLTAPLYGAERGSGTMPHSLVGYVGGDVLEATKLFVENVPESETVISLIDYVGREVDDTLRCAAWFFDAMRLDERSKRFGVRIDTHGGRFLQDLDYQKSVRIVGEWLGVEGEYNIVEEVLGRRAFQLDPGNILVDQVRRILFGKGVSSAAIIHIRQVLDKAGYDKALIVASSSFDPQKCEIMGAARAPIDMVGTGSFLPKELSTTYATADIIAYNGVPRVKIGREHLLSP